MEYYIIFYLVGMILGMLTMIIIENAKKYEEENEIRKEKK